MNELTKAQRATLDKFETHLHTAYYADYVVGLPSSHVRQLFDIYNELYGEHETNYTCNFCVLRVMKRLGGLYYSKSTKSTKSSKKDGLFKPIN